MSAAKTKINPKTGFPFGINPKTGLPFRIDPLTGKPVKKGAKAAIAQAQAIPATPVVAVPVPAPAPAAPSAPLRMKPITQKAKVGKDKLDKIMEALRLKGPAIKTPLKEKVILKPAKPRVLCPDCDREMSPALDMYYGRTSGADKFCTDCRHARFGEY